MTPFFRLTFVVYAIALFVATHWPRLAVPGSGFRVDLLIHASVFGLWNVLFVMTAWIGPRLSQRNLIASTFVAAGASVVDELSQALPIFDRTFGFDDMTANLLGVLLTGFVLRFIAAKSGFTGQSSDQTRG